VQNKLLEKKRGGWGESRVSKKSLRGHKTAFALPGSKKGKGESDGKVSVSKDNPEKGGWSAHLSGMGRGSSTKRTKKGEEEPAGEGTL